MPDKRQKLQNRI